MRLSIFIGLLYVAWCINPTTFDSLINKPIDLILIGIVFFLGMAADVKDFKIERRKR